MTLFAIKLVFGIGWIYVFWHVTANWYEFIVLWFMYGIADSAWHTAYGKHLDDWRMK